MSALVPIRQSASCGRRLALALAVFRQDLRGEPRRYQRRDQQLYMPSVLGLYHDIELGTLKRGIVKQALVMHLDDNA
jgi:hypothetical protein